MQVELLSVWDIAHWYNGVDPESTDPKALPRSVRYSLKQILLAIRHERLCVRCSAGDCFGWDGANSMPIGYGNTGDHPERFDPMSLADSLEHVDNAITGERYCRGFLTMIFVSRGDFEKWTSDAGIESRSVFDADSKGIKQQKAKTPTTKGGNRSNQIDKQIVQAVGRTLWDIDPNYTITALTKHKAIQIYANGKNYSQKIRHEWLADVDPRPKEKKRGRPRKLTSQNQ